jgi:NAD(P)-dependent dehydrogenase (short-subunit alcohol dehydrogenase family)
MAVNLKGHVTIITGAGAGIGKATAHRFAKGGARLVLVGRKEGTLQDTKKECLDINKELTDNDIIYVSADVSKDSDVEVVIKKTVEHFGEIHVLVNNAGFAELDTTETFNPDFLDNAIRLHVRGVALLIKYASPYLIKTKGSVVNVSSDSGVRPSPSFYSYCISKAAQNQLTKCAALDLGPKGVRVNAVIPGVVKTDIFQTMGLSQEEIDSFMKSGSEMYPLRRVCLPEEIANAIAFLASSDASYVNGACLPVEGGVILTTHQGELSS